MRILFLLTIGFFVVALICAGVPTTVAGLSWAFWLIAALLAWRIDESVDSGVLKRRGP